MRVHRSGEDGLPLHAGGCCSGAVVAEGRLAPYSCKCTGLGETGCLPVPVVTAQEGWSLRGGRSPLAASAPAKGSRVASGLGDGACCRFIYSKPHLPCYRFAFSSNTTSPKIHDKTLMCTSAHQLEFLGPLSFRHQ